MSIIICVGNQFAFQSKRLALLGARKEKFLTFRGNFDLFFADFESSRLDISTNGIYTLYWLFTLI